MKKTFKTYSANASGRDFVLGDIHGAYDLVLRGMKQVDFNPKVDRIFSVGDLIDRGSQSHRVLGFLSQPYVHAISGNHDADFATLSLDEMKVLGQANFNGLGWVLNVADEKLLAIKEKLAQLPIAMQIDTPRGTVGLVHGDVPAGMHWDAFVEALKAGDEKVVSVALWGRKRLTHDDDSGVPGIGRVFVGHTVQWNGPKRLGNVYAIDSGAVFREIDDSRGSLTMVNMACKTGVLAPSVNPEGPPAVFTDADEGAGSFGSYAKPKRF